MKWQKKGLIYGPSGEKLWANNSALQPPVLLTPIIRLYLIRDEHAESHRLLR
jgi:hypothetical protein